LNKRLFEQAYFFVKLAHSAFRDFNVHCIFAVSLRSGPDRVEYQTPRSRTLAGTDSLLTNWGGGSDLHGNVRTKLLTSSVLLPAAFGR